MSDFLTNLIGRSRGVVEVVQPRVPSIYEPHRRDGSLVGTRPGFPGRDADSESAVETVSAGETQAIPTNSRDGRLSPQAKSPRPSRGNPVQDRAVQDSPVMPILNPPPAVAVVSDHRPLNQTRAADDDRQPLNQTLPAVIDRRYSERPSPSLVAQKMTTAVSAVRPPLPSVTGEPVGSSPSSSPPKPAIQVSIGRVEVRAVFPEPTVRRAPPPRSRPTVSLDEYLGKQRGKR